MSDGKEVAGRAGKTWLPSAKKFGEFVLAVFQIKRSLATMKKDNKHVPDEVLRLQRRVDENAGQLKTMRSFTQITVLDQAARSGERAAMSVMQQFLRLGPKTE